MKLGTALLLLVFGALALGGGWYYGARAPSYTQTTADSGRLVFPGLAPDLRQASFISILHGGKTLVLERRGDVWGVQDRGDYPVQPAKVHALLTGLTELRLSEQRTSDPAEFARLGLEDPHASTANATLLRVLDAKVQPIAELIVGHQRGLTGGNLPEQVYVRRPSENQTWLAEGHLDVDADPQSWFDRDIVNIEPGRIKTVDILRGDQHLAFAATDGKLAMTAPEEHPKLDDDKVADISRALEALTFTDVKPIAQLPGKALGHAVFTTNEGLIVAVEVNQAGTDIWAHLTATGTPPEAATLDKKLSPWAYQIGSWKESALVPTLAALAAPAPPAPPPAPPPAAVAPVPAAEPAPAAAPAPAAEPAPATAK